MTAIHVVPAPGLLIRDPDRGFDVLPPEGRLVPETSYWLRLAEAGDVRIDASPVAPPSAETNEDLP